MAKSKSSFWKHPVVSTVVGGLILSYFTGLGSHLLGFLSVVKQYLVDIYEYLNSSSTLPVWWVCSTSVYFVISIILKCTRQFFSTVVSWDNYKRDVFWGVEWRWSYFGSNEISNLHSLCPKCKYQLFPYNNCWQMVSYKCGECGYSVDVKSEGSGENDIKQRVRLKIQRKLRTGEWRDSAK
ncbi:hypothetical protein ACM6XU_001760 [Vibrio parahaemolyticus]